MGRRLPLYSLTRRIIVSVALCLAVILTLYLLVALWTIEESTEVAFRERTTLAKVLAERVDDALIQALRTVQAEAATLSVGPDHPLTDPQRHRLSSLGPPGGTFSRIAVVDVDGAVIWSEPALEAGSASVTDLLGPQATLPMDRPAITRLTLGRMTRARLVVPLAGPDGAPSGALVADLDPTDPSLGLLPRRSIDGGVVAQLMDAEGRLLAGAGVPGPRGGREHVTLMADLIQTQTPGHRIHESVPDAPFARHVVAYAPVTALPSWGVAVEQPIDQVLAMPKQLGRRLAVTGAASFALIIALAWLDVRRVVRPLRHLTEAAERIADGRLDEPLRVDRRDELGLLARAFETMRQELRASLVKVQSLAILEERERIAREMHDGLGQVLGFVNTKTLAVARLLEVGRIEEARVQVAQLEGMAKDVYADVREAILGLRTTLSRERDLLAALREYVAGFEQQSGIHVELDVSGWPPEPPLPLAAEIQLVRIVQEALANVRKHAQAQGAVVRLVGEHGEVRLSIVDDGRGFDPSRPDREGWPRFGLQTMRERAEGVGGSFTIDSRPGAGTQVTISIPARDTPTRAGTEVRDAAYAGAPG
jgi:signal transduction histidine kinase